MALYPELKKQWVDALRSGKYKQTKGTLHNLDDGGFCCIGVACVVWGISSAEYMGVELQKDSFENEGPLECYTAWQKRSGLKNVQSKLTKMNDSGNYTFNEIADWIEEKL